jgi:hypothetical protein
VELSAREFGVLLALVESRPRVLSRAQIEAKLYSWDHALDSNAIEVHVHHLRRKLGDGVIRTLRGVGYFCAREPAWGKAMMARRSLTPHLLAWALGALLVVWISFVVVGYLTGRHEADELTDGHLASVASLLLAERDGRFAIRGDPAALAGPSTLKSHDYQQTMSVVVWNATGDVLTRTGDAPTPPFAPSEGLRDAAPGQPGCRMAGRSRAGTAMTTSARSWCC